MQTERQRTLMGHFHALESNLRNYALFLCKNQADAADLFQNTALKILENAEKFKLGTDFKNWAFVIMRNTFINRYRQINKRRSIHNKGLDAHLIRKSPPSMNAGEDQLSCEELHELIDDLPEFMRTPFKMAYEGYNYKEISSACDTPVGTIKSRIHSARRKLRSRYHSDSMLPQAS